MSLTGVLSLLAGLIVWVGLIGKPGLTDIVTGVVVIISGWRLASRLTDQPASPSPLSRLPARLYLLCRYFFAAVFPSALLSAWNVIRLTVLWRSRFQPAIVEVSFPTASPQALFLISYAVTLSPGQQVIQIDEASKTLYIHALDAPVPENIKRHIQKQFTSYVKEIFP
jgi:multicomponent Na+:H+ antiporter subunit E